MAIENRLTAKRGLQAGHEKRGGDSFPADIGNGHADRRRAKLHKIVVVARDDACGTANSGQFQARKRWKLARKKLLLNFVSDGELVLKALPLPLLFDEF